MEIINEIITKLSGLQGTLVSLGFAILSIILGLLIYKLFIHLLSRWRRQLEFEIRGMKLKLEYLYGPIRALFPSLCLILVLPVLQLSENLLGFIRHLLGVWIIIVMAWAGIRVLTIVRELVLSKYELESKDNLKARQVHTQIKVIERILFVTIIIVAIAAVFMTFDKVRQIGVSILASAGILGVILGFAAQRSLSTLFAGIQIAITQPIRIDDVVIVENEWGWIEEITLTYVVVRIWDKRRLVVPITYFIEKPFENWTRVSADILGTVYIYADYTLPAKDLRNALDDILNHTPLWDGHVSVLQVTNMMERTVEFRALMSAENSPTAWELRCHVREKLLEYIKTHHPSSLPRLRVRMDRETKRNGNSFES